MTARGTRGSRVMQPAASAGRAVRKAFETREQVDVWMMPVATGAGWLGMVALLGCAVLEFVPARHFPTGLRPSHLPTYWVASLIAASLLGWSRMQSGMQVLRDKVGGGWGTVWFVVVPFLCFVLIQLDFHGLVHVRGWPKGRQIRWFGLWYPTVLVMACVAAQLHRQAGRGRRWRSRKVLAELVAVVPYGVMLAFLVFQVQVPVVGQGLHAMLRDAGAAAILIQLLLAFFIVT